MTESFKPHQIRGGFSGEGLRFGLVVSRFNSFITERLLSGALAALEQAGASADQTDIVHVPGSFEIPLAAKKLGLGARHDAIVAIGCILRGETAHFDYVASEVSRGIQLAQMDTGVPVIFCVLTCDTLEQAIDRAGLKGGNKGYDAGLAAIEMAQLSRRLGKGAADRGACSESASAKCRLVKSSRVCAANAVSVGNRAPATQPNKRRILANRAGREKHTRICGRTFRRRGGRIGGAGRAGYFAHR